MPAAEYVCHHVRLVVRTPDDVCAWELGRLLRDLSFVETAGGEPRSDALALSVRPAASPLSGIAGRPCVFDSGGLRGIAVDAGVCLTEGTSLLRVRESGWATASLAPGFFSTPDIVRQRFWAFGLLALLRSRGLYGLHAAALTHPAGAGILLIGPSGSGKSTLALGLLRQGWRYLSDDAVLVRRRTAHVEALALRKPFAVNGTAGSKRRVDVHAAYPDQYRPACRPAVAVFPRIVGSTRSTLRPMPKALALGRLLAQSGPELFDRGSARAHMETLRALLDQTATYELCAGADLHERPATLADLLAHAEGGWDGPHHPRAHQPL